MMTLFKNITRFAFLLVIPTFFLPFIKAIDGIHSTYAYTGFQYYQDSHFSQSAGPLDYLLSGFLFENLRLFLTITILACLAGFGASFLKKTASAIVSIALSAVSIVCLTIVMYRSCSPIGWLVTPVSGYWLPCLLFWGIIILSALRLVLPRPKPLGHAYAGPVGPPASYVCHRCGAVQPAGPRFCGQCGGEMQSGPPVG